MAIDVGFVNNNCYCFRCRKAALPDGVVAFF